MGIVTIIGNILAKEFGLSAPKAAFIDFTEEFKFTLNVPEQQQLAIKDDSRLKFGTEYCEGAIRYQEGTYKTTLNKFIEIDTLYAFDMMIRNSDRGAAKPNLLLANDAGLIIDHELCLKLGADTISTLEGNRLGLDSNSSHICHHFLKKSKIASKRNYFDTFEEYLRVFNPNILQPYFSQLNAYHYNPDIESYNEYFAYIKNNSRKFVNILKTSIQ